MRSPPSVGRELQYSGSVFKKQEAAGTIPGITRFGHDQESDKLAPSCARVLEAAEKK
jgi:hypothetical protein